MLSSFALVILVFAPAQGGDNGPDRVRFVRGQEYVYRGTVRDEVVAAGSIVRRNYELETHAFVLDVKDGSAQVAFQTVLRSAADDKLGSVRIELARAAANGTTTFESGEAVRSGADAPPTFEPAGFVLLAHGHHPVEHVHGVRCVRITRVDSVAGGTQRQTAWVAVATGVVRKLERSFEQFTGGEPMSSHTIATAYELASEVVVPDALAAGRRREIRQASQAQDRLREILPNAGRVGPRPFEHVLLTLAAHVEAQPATPYRPAVLWLQTRAEAGKRGDAPAPKRVP